MYDISVKSYDEFRETSKVATGNDSDLARSLLDAQEKTHTWKRYTCPVCFDKCGETGKLKNRVFHGNQDWDAHVRSKSHNFCTQRAEKEKAASGTKPAEECS